MEQSSRDAIEHTEDFTIAELEENHFAAEAAKNALLGRIYTEKPLNKKVVKGMIRKGWGNPEGLTIVDISTNTFLFNFSNSETPNKILEDADVNYGLNS